MDVVTRFGLARRLLLAPTLLALSLGWSACRRPAAAPPPPPPPPPAATTAAPAPPPPPPKCESVGDNCKAEAATRVEIGDSGIEYSPPSGWSYVKAVDHALAAEGQGAAVVGFAVVAQDSRDEVLAAVEKLSTALELEGVKLDKLKKRLKKPQQKLEGANGEIELWEITASTQGGKAPELKGKGRGTALLALARVATEREAVVLGFVVEPDEQGQAANIMKAVESLAVKR